MKRFKGLHYFCLFILALFGCGGHMKKSEVLVRPAQASQTTPAQGNTTEVDQLIAKARQNYFLGERELNLGHLEKAKMEFDAALDILMQYQSDHAPNPNIQAVIDEIGNKVYEREMAALKEGDGFTEHPLEPALIDDLKNINTFPAPDENTKHEVEQELKSENYDIPVEVNDTVLSFIRIFQNSRRNEFVGGLIRSGRYLNRMKQIFKEEGLPEDLVYTALIESSFKANAYSHAQAKGFWQFISGTAKRYGLKMDWWVDERSDFEKSTRAAARYLKDLHDMFGDWYLALAGYNTGENNIVYAVNRTGESNFWQLVNTRYMRPETKNYVPAILAGMIIAKNPEKYGFGEQIEDALDYDTVNINYVVDLRLVAECTGASLEEIRMLNPELNRLTTPSNMGNYDLRLPKNTKNTYLAEIEAVPEQKRITWRKHEVKPGETLTAVAALYRTSPNSIREVNSLEEGATLTVGQKLVIPIGRSNPVNYAGLKYAPETGKKNFYAVRTGDTLYKIATRFGTSVEQLCQWNGISPRHTLRKGESVLVKLAPPVVASNEKRNQRIVYQVKKGDTLYQIANNYNTDVDSIRRWNKFGSEHEIYPGDRLTLFK